MHDWTPFTARLKTEALGTTAAAPSPFSSDDTRRLLALSQAIAAQEGPAVPQSPAPVAATAVPAPAAPAQPAAPPMTPRPAPNQAAGMPRPVVAAAQATPEAPTNAQGIEDPAVAARVFEHLARLSAVEDRAGKPQGGPTVYVFFDPRCPYCHQAFRALQGKVAARWIPVIVLGNPEDGRAQARAILSANDPVGALRTTFDGQGMRGGASPELDAKLQENMEAFAAIFQASPGTRPGVPTFFIPRPDGRLTMLVGYEAGDEAKVEAVLRGAP